MQLPSDKIRVLNHGYVQLIDVMGDDQAIVDAARVSIAGENVKSVQSNEGLIRYLMRHWHTTPLEMVEFKFRCAMPIFVARQWIRHRTANVNEMSGRYSELPEEYYVPEDENIRFQATANKQGRSDAEMDSPAYWKEGFDLEAAKSFGLYRERLEAGMARELARANLPLSTFTCWIWKIDLHNLFHFLRLRLHSHAQWEIRVYGEAMAGMIKPFVPIAYQAFEDYRLHATTLTRQDKHAIRQLLLGVPLEDDSLAGCFPTKRELAEFKQKWADVLSEGET